MSDLLCYIFYNWCQSVPKKVAFNLICPCSKALPFCSVNTNPVMFRYEGYKLFLEEILLKDNVWIVPVAAGIEYRKNPVTNQDLIDKKFEPFNCDSFPAEDCPSPSVCE